MLSRCLLTNDDGPTPLLEATIEIVRPLVHHLTVIIPQSNRTASSSAITTGSPLKLRFDRSKRVWLIGGFPADGVRYALSKMFSEAPSVLVSGINNDFNLGRCIVNSGTVGAAMEGTRCGVPALCLSSDRCMKVISDSWKQAVRHLVTDCFQFIKDANAGAFVLNINLPGKIRTEKLDAVYLPVSQAEYDEFYEEKRTDGRLEILRRGKAWREDPDVPEFKLLKQGKAVVNLLRTPWTEAGARLERKLKGRFESL